MRRAFALAFALALALASSASSAPGNEKDLLSLPAEARIADAERFLGDIPLNSRTTHAFTVENAGPGILEILFVQSPSVPEEKSAAESFDRFVMPGKSGRIVVALDVKGWPPGPFAASYVLLTNQKGIRPMMKLHGVLRSGVQMHPQVTTVHFETGRGFAVHRAFVLHAEQNPGFAVTDIESPLPILWEARPAERATLVKTNWPQKPEVWARRGDVILQIKLDPDAPVGEHTPKEVVVKTDIPGYDDLRFYASASVRGSDGRRAPRGFEWEE